MKFRWLSEYILLEIKKEREAGRKCETVKGMMEQDKELVQRERKIKGQEREERSSVRSTVVHFAWRQLQPQLTNPEGPLGL